jgi:nucleoid DNA-binding protein
MSELVTGYYDTSDLVKRLESQTGLDEDVLRDVINLAFQNIAEAAGKGVNAVILDDIGTFRLASCIGRRYVTNGKEVIKKDCLKFKFKGAIKLRNIVAANLREQVKHLEVK